MEIHSHFQIPVILATRTGWSKDGALRKYQEPVLSHSLLIPLLRSPLSSRRVRTLADDRAMSLRKAQLGRLSMWVLIIRIRLRVSHQRKIKATRWGTRREDECCGTPLWRVEAAWQCAGRPRRRSSTAGNRRHNRSKQEISRVLANYSYCEESNKIDYEALRWRG